MKKISYGFILLTMLLCLTTFASAEVRIGIGLPSVNIGINLPMFPRLTVVPGYPVYYAPQMDANYFFYDGMYWVYWDDNWYASSWYNGPWGIVEPDYVPHYVLRIPVRYYRQPPVYFRGWHSNAPPRWNEHWGRDWEQRRPGWNRWNRRSAPAPAPLPVYQRKFTGDRYPKVEQQHNLRSNQYRYKPRDTVVREHFKQIEQKTPPPAQKARKEAPLIKSQKQPDAPHVAPIRQGIPGGTQSPPPAHRDIVETPKSAPPPPAPHKPAPPAVHQQQPAPAPHPQQAPRVKEREQRPPDRGESQERRGRGQGDDRDEGRGRGHN